MTVILASTSPIRQTLLKHAGVEFTVRSHLADEAQLKKTLGLAKPADMAMALAEAKARSVSGRQSLDLVIGADQVLEHAGAVFDKPHDLAGARVHLAALRGKTHQLHSALACARGGEIIWRCAATARLTMRSFSQAFLDSYLTRMGVETGRSVGAYQLESEGIQLFEKVEGDYFTILGLPLLPLLALLREQGELAS
ncbi:MAG: Maf family protein [Hyphomicrobiales bacterium]